MVSFSDAAGIRLRRVLRIIEGTERDGPDESGRRRYLRQSAHALEDRRLAGEAPVPVGLNRTERRAVVIETAAGGRCTGVVPGGPAVTGQAGGLVDERVLRHRIAETRIET